MKVYSQARASTRTRAEMKLDESKGREDPRERLKKIRAELAARVGAG